MLNPNSLLSIRSWYSERTDNEQMTQRGCPNFNSYITNLRVLVFRMDRQTDRRMGGQRDTIESGHSQSGRFLGRSLPPSFILISRHFCNFSKSPNFLFLVFCFLSQHFIFESCSLLLVQTVQLGTYFPAHQKTVCHNKHQLA